MLEDASLQPSGARSPFPSVMRRLVPLALLCLTACTSVVGAVQMHEVAPRPAIPADSVEVVVGSLGDFPDLQQRYAVVASYQVTEGMMGDWPQMIAAARKTAAKRGCSLMLIQPNDPYVGTQVVAWGIAKGGVASAQALAVPITVKIIDVVTLAPR